MLKGESPTLQGHSVALALTGKPHNNSIFALLQCQNFIINLWFNYRSHVGGGLRLSIALVSGDEMTTTFQRGVATRLAEIPSDGLLFWLMNTRRSSSYRTVDTIGRRSSGM
jgi:hypothetical protein